MSVRLVTVTIVQLSLVIHACLAPSRQKEDLGNVLHVLVECLPGLEEPLNVNVSIQICITSLHVCVCACVWGGGVGGWVGWVGGWVFWYT